MFGVSKIEVIDRNTLLTLDFKSSIPGLYAEIFSLFAESLVKIDMISSSVKSDITSLSFTICDDDLSKALEIVAKLKSSKHNLKPVISSSNCKIEIFGEEMRDMYGIAANVFEAVAQSGVELLTVTTSQNEISLLTTRPNSDLLYNLLKKKFGL